MRDEDFIEWASRDRWTPTEAVFVLHGQLPEPCSTDELVKRFPASIKMLQRYYLLLHWREPGEAVSIEYDALTRSANLRDVKVATTAALKIEIPLLTVAWVDAPLDARLLARRETLEARQILPASPFSWVRAALGQFTRSCVRVAQEWVAIFPLAQAKAPDASLGDFPDYRHFIGEYLTGTALPLSVLVRYALALPGSPARWRDKAEDRERLMYATTHLSAREWRSKDELEGLSVSARRFFDDFPRSSFVLDERCAMWVDWARHHKKLVRWLSRDPLFSLAAADAEVCSQWLSRDAWRLVEGVFLVLGYEPDLSGFFSSPSAFWHIADEAAAERIAAVYDEAKRSMDRQRLTPLTFRDGQYIGATFTPSEFLRWAEIKRYPLPAGLKDWQEVLRDPEPSGSGSRKPTRPDDRSDEDGARAAGSDSSDVGKALADFQHAPTRDLWKQAADEAERLWRSDDERNHAQMTTHLLTMPKFRLLKRNGLRGAIKARAYDIGRPDLVSGRKKPKTSP